MKVERCFKESFGTEYALSFNSGRSSFLAILKSLELKEGDEVLMQGFTCNAVVNPVLFLKLVPVFVDIEKESLNINPRDLEEKITSKSRAVIVQHTFGLGANMERIQRICQEHNLFLVEDCAHSLGAKYNQKKLGVFGDAAFFSFGRDKVISSVFGGMLIIKDKVLGEKITKLRQKTKYPNRLWILQQLLHPLIVEYVIKPSYKLPWLGKFLLISFQKLKILSKAVSQKEKLGKFSKNFFRKMPNALLLIAQNQIKKIEKFQRHSEKIAQIYFDKLKNSFGISILPKSEGKIYMRFPIIFHNKNTDEVLEMFRDNKILIDDGWRKAPIMPPDTDQERAGYIFGLCPNAEFVVNHIVNLPTNINISEKEAMRISDLLINFLKK